jgi:hypothetical protein
MTATPNDPWDDDEWGYALDDLAKGDSDWICDLLRGDANLSPIGREWLADCIEHLQFSRKRGRWTKAWEQSETNRMWWLACQDVRQLIADGDSKEVALKKVAKKIGRSQNQLKSALDGKIGSASRAERVRKQRL